MKESTSLVFTGDIGFDRYMEGRWEDKDLIDKEVLSFLHSGDHVVANVEDRFLMFPPIRPQKAQFSLCIP